MLTQLTAPERKGDRAPLIPMPVIDTPFSRIAMDIVGPLERSSAGHRYILVVCDYATRYPEAFPLRKVKARQIVDSLTGLVHKGDWGDVLPRKKKKKRNILVSRINDDMYI